MHDIIRFAVSYLVVFVMLGVGLRTRARDLFDELRRPGRVVVGVLAIDVAVPLLTFAVLQLVPVSERAERILVLFAICPAAPLVIGRIQKPETPGAVGLAIAVVLLAGAVVTVPAWLWIVDEAHAISIATYARDVGWLLTMKTFLPLAVGMAINHLSGRVADVAGRVISAVTVVVMLAAVVFLVVLGGALLRKATLPLVAAILLILAGDAFLIPRLAPRDDPSLRSALANLAMIGNPALVLAVLSHGDPSMHWGRFVAAYILFRAVAALPFQRAVSTRARQLAAAT